MSILNQVTDVDFPHWPVNGFEKYVINSMVAMQSRNLLIAEMKATKN